MKPEAKKAVKEIVNEIYENITEDISDKMSEHPKLGSLMDDGDRDDTVAIYEAIITGVIDKLKVRL